MSTSPKIIVLARDPAGDPDALLVAGALAERGAELLFAATSPYPAGAALELELRGGERPRIGLGGLRLDDADALWIRHLGIEGLPEGMRDDERAAALTQADAALWSAIACADGLVVDPPEALLAAPAKPRLQLLAARLGLEVPRALVTNAPAAVREFARACPGGLICKLVESGAITNADPEAPPQMPTIALDDEDLDHLEGLELGPMLFQERLRKRLEFRVTIVGHELFPAAVATGEAIDVRMHPALIRGLRPHDLPPALGRRLLALATHLGLNYATVDLVLTEEGRWVLLELNTTSYFEHVERHAGLPIAAALADLLLGRRPPRAQRAALVG